MLSWTLLWCLGAPVASQPPASGVVTLPVDGTEDLTGTGRAFIELSAGRDTCFVQENIRVRLRLGVEARFLEANMVQLFHRELDMPVQVQAPWFEGLPASPPQVGASFAFSDSVAKAQAHEQTVAGKQFKVLEVERSYLPTDAGRLTVPAPILRFAYATRFQEDFVKGRVPLDRRHALVRGKPLTFDVRPLPTKGRPAGFTGAVGQFTVSAEARPRTVLLGTSFKLILQIAGTGNLGSFAPPRLDLKGFHVLGQVDNKDKVQTHRIVTYDLAPLTGTVREVPPIRFAFFDPRAEAYRTVETAPLPLDVEPRAGGGNATPWPVENTVPGVNDIFDIKPGSPDKESAIPSPVLWWTLALAPWLLVMLWFWARGRAQVQARLDQAQVRNAVATFRSGAPVPEAFAQFLADLLGCSTAAVVAPDLKPRLEARGLPPELAGQATDLLEELFAHRYGGNASVDGEQAAQTLVAAVDAAFR